MCVCCGGTTGSFLKIGRTVGSLDDDGSRLPPACTTAVTYADNVTWFFDSNVCRCLKPTDYRAAGLSASTKWTIFGCLPSFIAAYSPLVAWYPRSCEWCPNPWMSMYVCDHVESLRARVNALFTVLLTLWLASSQFNLELCA